MPNTLAKTRKTDALVRRPFGGVHPVRHGPRSQHSARGAQGAGRRAQGAGHIIKKTGAGRRAYNKKRRAQGAGHINACSPLVIRATISPGNQALSTRSYKS